MEFTQSFEITRWEPAVYDDRDGVVLARVEVYKLFDGELTGTSTAELLSVGTTAGPSAYTAVERFDGTLSGREGTFVLVHGAGADSAAASGYVATGTGTGELTGLRGTVTFVHDDEGPRLTFDYELPGAEKTAQD
ncbi:MAG TPA: DUF3224 domain-containing protein [Kribbellaceae bacterium]|nr:DUF3224 domain-containing protein [Kribbellaceae bacterium]